MATHSSVLAWRPPGAEPRSAPPGFTPPLPHSQRVSSCSGTRLPHPWDSPGKNTGVGSCSLPQGNDEDLREPLVRRQGSQVSMRVARVSTVAMKARRQQNDIHHVLEEKSANSVEIHFVYTSENIFPSQCPQTELFLP